jgi:biotin operon repressor
MEIKHSNWFAAGPEVQRALLSLSDGGFRLYFHICLNASRKTGRISMSYLAHTLGRSRRTITSHFDELRRKGICHIHPAVNQHNYTQIEVCDEFWPYTKTHGGIQPSEREEYLAHIKTFLSKRGCVRATFTAADENIAGDLLTRQVPLERIERAIALGCCRKYVSLLNGTDRGAIFSFAYFRDLIEEVRDSETPSGYWDYVMPELERLEKKWLASNEAAHADLASAGGPKNQETR